MYKQDRRPNPDAHGRRATSLCRVIRLPLLLGSRRIRRRHSLTKTSYKQACHRNRGSWCENGDDNRTRYPKVLEKGVLPELLRDSRPEQRLVPRRRTAILWTAVMSWPAKGARTQATRRDSPMRYRRKRPHCPRNDYNQTTTKRCDICELDDICQSLSAGNGDTCEIDGFSI